MMLEVVFCFPLKIFAGKYKTVFCLFQELTPSTAYHNKKSRANLY